MKLVRTITESKCHTIYVINDRKSVQEIIQSFIFVKFVLVKIQCEKETAFKGKSFNPFFSVKLPWAVLVSSLLTIYFLFCFSNGQKRKKKKQRSRDDESSSSSSSSSEDSDSNSDSDSDKNNDKKKLGKRDTKQVKYGLKSKQIVKKLWCLLGCTSDKVNYR